MTRPFCPSWQLLSRCFKGIHKALQADLEYRNVSIIDKMMEEPPSNDFPDGSGTRNFLDAYNIAMHTLRGEGRVEEAHELARWTSHVSGGFFTPYFEPSGLHDNDFCIIVNRLMNSMTNAIEELRLSYFLDGKKSFTKEERSRFYKAVDELMGKALQARAFVHAHKSENPPQSPFDKGGRRRQGDLKG